MTQYSEEFKAGLIAKMLPPNNVGVPELARETGIPQDTLYSWRLKHRRSNGDGAVKHVPSGGPSSEETFAVVMETASLNEVEFSAYCRRKGLYPEQLHAWRKACQQANASAGVGVDRDKLREQAKEIKPLQEELRRKDKALAETAALLVLQKKSPHFLGGARGRKINLAPRQRVVTWIDEACSAGARSAPACAVLGISPRTLQRWREHGGGG